MTMLRAGSPGEAGVDAAQIERVRGLCADWVKAETPALAVCVARRGIVVLDEAFGRLHWDDEQSPPLEPDSIFPLSSGTKPLTATLVLQLVQEGRIGISRRVREYLPEIQCDSADDLLVHHLLTHTSGYLFHTDEPMVRHVMEKLAAGLELPPCPDNQHPVLHETFHLFSDVPLAWPPGERMYYSNHNYELLGELVRRVSGRSLEDQARERVFDPLGMDDTYYVLPEALDARVVRRPPIPGVDEGTNRYFEGFGSRQVKETPYAGVGVYGTARNLAAFGQMFLNGGAYGDARILSPATVRAMTRNQIPGIPAQLLHFQASEGSWGYGWAVESHVKWEGYTTGLLPPGAYHHSGLGGIYLWVDPENEIVGAYFEAAPVRADMMMDWCADRFVNAVTAAVLD